MSIGLKSDSSGTSGSIVINGSDKVVVTSAGNVTAGTFTGAVVGAVTGNVTGNVTGSLTAGGSLNLATAVATTSGTAIDFTGIPSWVKRVTVVFSGVSASGTSNYLLQIGSGSVLTTGYDSAASSFNDVNTGSTSGFILTAGNVVVASTVSGVVVLAGINPSTNTWVSSGNVSNTANPPVNGASHLSGGNRALSGALDRVRLTTVNGTDTFDAGSVNIMYEG